MPLLIASVSFLLCITASLFFAKPHYLIIPAALIGLAACAVLFVDLVESGRELERLVGEVRVKSRSDRG